MACLPNLTDAVQGVSWPVDQYMKNCKKLKKL